MNIYEEMKKYRLKSGLTQEKLASRLGKPFTRHSVSRVESGARDCTYSLIEKWFTACGWEFEGFCYRVIKTEALELITEDIKASLKNREQITIKYEGNGNLLSYIYQFKQHESDWPLCNVHTVEDTVTFIPV